MMAGASGFLGGTVAARLRHDGHQVIRLVRRPAAGPDEVSWQPASGVLDPAAVSAADAVINLAGSPLGLNVGRVELPVRPWTAHYRKVFRASRVGTTATLAQAIAAADPKPATFLAGSAVGWYGDTGDTEVDEGTAAGEGFFADTCRSWEAATGPAEAAGVRVVRLRTGQPLARDGGLIGPLVPLFRLGLGGKLASGRQWLPWISMADWLDAVMFLLHHDQVAGPVNLVGPAPVTNAEFTAELGRLVHRPTVIRVPAFALRLALGAFGRDVAASKRVLPTALHQAGFLFTHRDLAAALRAALDRPGDR